MTRDSELDLLLRRLQTVAPSEQQMDKWLSAVRRKAPRSARRVSLSWCAAMLVTGFVVGTFFPRASEKSELVATTQYVFSKSE